MREREWLSNDDLITRFGLFIAASYALYVGVVQWGSAVDARHPWIVVLELLTYAVAFAFLLSAATGTGLKWTRRLIPVLYIAALLIQAYLFLERQQPLAYGTDSAAYTHYAAELTLQGQNPYGQDLSSSLPRFHMPPTLRTGRIDGTFEAILPYPALSFLIYIPFIAAGLADLRIVLLIFHLALLILLYAAAPPRFKPLVLVPFFVSPEIIAYTLGTVTDVTWVIFMTAAAVLWKHRNASALLFGVAASIKQHPWVILPFLLLRIWMETDGLSTQARLAQVARYFGIAELVFLLVNGPFIIASPQAWLEGVLAPPLGPLVMDGEGLSVLSQIGLVYAPRTFYTISTLLVAGALAVLYAANFKRWANAVWLLPAIILWFPYRSLQSYFIYWIPPLLVTLYASWRTLPDAQKSARSTPVERAIRMPFRRVGFIGRLPLHTAVSILAGAVPALFVLGGIGFYAVTGKPALPVELDRAVLDPRTNLITQVEVTVVNRSDQVIHPVFWVKETGHPRFHWDIVRGPDVLVRGEQAQYALRAAFPEYEIPNRNTFSVVVNDAADANTTSFSAPLAVNLDAHASLINPDFLYWTAATGTQVEQPYAWGFYQTGNDKARSARIAPSAVDGQRCLAITTTQIIRQDQTEWLGGFLDQWIEFPVDKMRVPVYPTFSYTGGDSPERVTGIEIHDEAHRLWYIFSDAPERVWLDPANPGFAYHLINAPLNQWSNHMIDIAADYRALGWELPPEQGVVQDGQTLLKRMVNFRVFVAAQELGPAAYSACFGAIEQHIP